ncbi:hypothetical protein H0H92_005295 [Tricholoma furcatifolium]|nr:hypothetical protein H0H92_005295 [Tricholoma furcatifolium]
MANDQATGSSFLRRLGRTITGKSLSIFSKSASTDGSHDSNSLGSSHAAKPVFSPTSATHKNLSDQSKNDSFERGESNISGLRPSSSNQANFTPPPAYTKSFSSVNEHDTSGDTNEPTSLALKIQSLVKALPLPTNNPLRSPSQPKSPKRNSNVRSAAPAGENTISDANLIAMLQNATVMNGGNTHDKRMSVFSVLETLEESSLHEEGAKGRPDPSLAGQGQVSEEVEEEALGIMMYSPLMPTNLSLVEIAESGVFSDEEGQQRSQQVVDPNSETAQAAGWMGMWPFSSFWHDEPAVAGTTAKPTRISPNPSIPQSMPGSPMAGRNAQLHGQARPRRRVWIPSSRELSFQAVWWGYRIYLPPPVMDALGDNTIEAARRAALVTTALTWFFSNIPLPSMPPALQPVILMLQTLIPYIGYLGSFISWSWGTIQSYDTGHGVVLTATWLLPIALIPSTWEADDFPPPSPRPSSSPLPNIYASPLPRSPAALPIPPPLPLSSPTPNTEIPIQPHPGLDSPALSFVTAPTQSPQPYLRSPTLVPVPPQAMSPNPWASPQTNSSHSPTIYVTPTMFSPLVPIVTAPTSPLQSPQTYSQSPALVPVPVQAMSPNPWASPQANTSHSPAIYATPTMLSPLQVTSSYPLPSSPLPSLPPPDPFSSWVVPPAPMPATIPLPEVDARNARIGTSTTGIRDQGNANLEKSDKRRRKAEGEERRRVDENAQQTSSGTERRGKRLSKIAQALGSSRKGEGSKSTAPRR